MTTPCVVGRGRPPVHTRFKKGQSGNPGGKPGPAKAARQRLCQAVERALALPSWQILNIEPESALEEIANKMVLSAVNGDARAIRTLLELTGEDRRRRTDPAAATSPGEAPACHAQDASLTDGQSQGTNESEPASADELQPEQAIGDGAPPCSGNASGTQTEEGDATA